MSLEDLANLNTSYLSKGEIGIDLNLNVLEFRNIKFANDLKLSWRYVEKFNQEILNNAPEFSRKKFDFRKSRKNHIKVIKFFKLIIDLI